MRKKMTIALGGAAALLWLSGLLLTAPVAHAQTATDQTDQTTKTKKKRKSAKSTEAPSATSTSTAPSAASTETPSAATTPAETGKKPRKSKKSTTEVPPQSFVPPATAAGGKAEESAAPVKNATPGQIQSAKSSGMVWVNTDSGVYHKGGRWYGKTKQGKFMTEDEAVRAGYKAAKNEK